ncbi:MAG: right-handed parallel beta-helix repeat-containing protein [Candidatus Hydrogenedens sp.]|nr:right-handed parallel beta-helix repeat-containing protein [Candidatus Hydrogenedens sp.]
MHTMKKTAIILTWLLAFLCFGTTSLCALEISEAKNAATVYYVNASSAASKPDGSSWAKAYQDIQSAVDAAAKDSEVWVAAGTYRSTSDIVLTMKEGVALYGGFAGNESERKQRNWDTNETIINGDGERRCVLGADNAVLDGFVIAQGFVAFDDDDDYYDDDYKDKSDFPDDYKLLPAGAGMLNVQSSPTVANCIFEDHSAYSGGGMYNFESSPAVTDCRFSSNRSDWGGGMTNTNSSPTITNCSFENNYSSGGGGMENNDSSPTLTNCSFENNIGGEAGGGILNWTALATVNNCRFMNNVAGWGGGVCNLWGADAVITNCIFANNVAGEGTGVAVQYSDATLVNCSLLDLVQTYYSFPSSLHIDDSDVTLINCILWAPVSGRISKESGHGNTTVLYSCIKGGYRGEGNISSDPLFADAPDNMRLSPDSPCIDAGTSSGAPGTDILGRKRPQGKGIDMGAYEYHRGDEDYVPDDDNDPGDGTEQDDDSNIKPAWGCGSSKQFYDSEFSSMTVKNMQSDLLLLGVSVLTLMSFSFFRRS